MEKSAIYKYLNTQLKYHKDEKIKIDFKQVNFQVLKLIQNFAWLIQLIMLAGEVRLHDAVRNTCRQRITQLTTDWEYSEVLIW